MSNIKFDLDNFLPYRLSVAANEVSQDFAKRYRSTYDLNRAEWRIICHLSQLGDDDAISVRDLEQRVHLEKSKVSRAVQRLEDRDIVVKNQNAQDGRLLEIRMTPKGNEIFSQLVPIANAYQESLLPQLSAEEKVQFIELLAKLAKG